MRILLVFINFLLLLLLSSQVPFSQTLNHPAGDRIEITSDPSPSPGSGTRSTVFQASATFVKGFISNTATVPEPVIIFLLGWALVGMGILFRKGFLKQKKK